MPKFLTRDEVYSLLSRELPEDAYPEGSASGSFSGADNGSIASLFGAIYDNQERIYENYFPQTALEKIDDWESKVFPVTPLGGLTTQERRDRIIARIRLQQRTTPQDMLNVVYTILPMSTLVEIVELGCSGGAWVLDESELDISTILNGWSGVQFGFRSDWCSVTAAELGISEQDYLDYREEVYTYEVRIYDTVLTAEQRQALDEALTPAEPRRSRHVIVDNLDSADMISGDE